MLAMHLLGPEDLAVNPSRVKGFQAGYPRLVLYW